MVAVVAWALTVVAVAPAAVVSAVAVTVTALGLRLGGSEGGVRDRIRHLLEHDRVDVGGGVAGRVVARVIRLASSAAEDGGLLRRLDALGAGEQPACRNARLDEREVVAASVEVGGRRGQALRGEVVQEDVLDRVRALGPCRAECITVAVNPPNVGDV